MAHIYGWQVSAGCWLEAPFPSYIDPFIESLECPPDMHPGSRKVSDQRKSKEDAAMPFKPLPWESHGHLHNILLVYRPALFNVERDSIRTWILGGKSLQGSSLGLAITLILTVPLPEGFFPKCQHSSHPHFIQVNPQKSPY